MDCREKSSTSKPVQSWFLIQLPCQNSKLCTKSFFSASSLPMSSCWATVYKMWQRLAAIDRVWAAVSWGRKLRNCCRCCFGPRWRLTDRIEAKIFLVHFPPRHRKREWQLGGMTTSCSGAYTINFYGTVLAVLLIYIIKVTVCMRACVLVCLV